MLEHFEVEEMQPLIPNARYSNVFSFTRAKLLKVVMFRVHSVLPNLGLVWPEPYMETIRDLLMLISRHIQAIILLVMELIGQMKDTTR